MRGYLEFGARATAQQLLQADRRIALAVFELAGCFERVDAILSPTAPQAAFAFDQKPPDNQSGFTILANFAGCPAISLPMGKTADGLPLGLQVMAPVGREDRVLQVAAAYEAAAGWQAGAAVALRPGVSTRQRLARVRTVGGACGAPARRPRD